MLTRKHPSIASNDRAGRRARRAAPVHLVTSCALLVAACADGTVVDAADVTARPVGDGVVSGRIHGTVVIPSVDSLTAWRASAGVRVDVAVGDPGARLDVIATTSTDAAGRFVFPALDGPAERLYVRATPTESGYRATRWLAAPNLRDAWGSYTLVGPDGAASLPITVGPYVVLERAGAPTRAYAPILLMGHVLRPGTRSGLADARVVFGHTSAAGADIVASARTDAQGFFLVQLADVGAYAYRVAPPLGSPFAERPVDGRPFAVTAFPDATASNYLLTEVRPR